MATVRLAVAVVVAPLAVGVTEAKSIEAGRLMLTEASIVDETVGASGAAYVACGKDGNNIKPNTNTKAQQLTVPASPSHDK